MKTIRLIFIFSFVFYVLCAIFFHSYLNMPTDAKSFYIPVAENIVAGSGYVLNGEFSYRYPPALPLIYALTLGISKFFGTPEFIYLLFIALIQSFSCTLVYKIGFLLKNSRLGVMSIVLFMTYPFVIVTTTTQYAWNHTALFTVFFLLFTYLFLLGQRKTSLFIIALSGTALSMSSLTWPSSFYFFLVAILFLIFKKEQGHLLNRIKLSFFFLIGFLPAILIWQNIIYQETGETKLISTGKIASMRDGLRRHEGSKFDRFDFVQAARKAELKGELEDTKDVMLYYLKRLLNHPLDTIAYIFFKIARPWYATDSEKKEGLTFLIQAPYLLLGFFGILVCLKDRMPNVWFLLIIIGYFWLVAFSVLSILRYMIPAMCLWMIFVAVGLNKLWPKITQQRTLKL